MHPPGDDPMPWRRYKHIDPRRYLTHATAKLGRRGTILGLLGTIWVFMGISVLIAPDNPTYLLASVAGPARAVTWIITGMVAIGFATAPQGRDALGFLALYVMAWYKAMTFGLGAYFWLITGGEDGSLRGLIGVASWLTILALILVISGWREPEREASPRDAP